jgi:hypothetical protein
LTSTSFEATIQVYGNPVTEEDCIVVEEVIEEEEVIDEGLAEEYVVLENLPPFWLLEDEEITQTLETTDSGFL